MSGKSDPIKETLVDEVVAELAEDAARTYRIDPEAAKEVIAPLIQADLALSKALSSKGELKELQRMRAYKDAAKKTRRAVYTHLRRYKREEGTIAEATARLEAVPPGSKPAVVTEAVEAILAGHASTAERIGHRDAFIEAISTHLSGVCSVLDVGSGVMPLMFPFHRFPDIQRYFAIDRDKEAMSAVNAFAGSINLDRLVAQYWAISDGWDELSDHIGREMFDVAFLFKLVPVVSRIESKHLDVLANTPARTLIVSGSVQALAKRQTIMQREAGAINTFANDFGFRIVSRFKTSDEIFFVMRR